MNYRTLYKKHYGIKFGPEYEVHHIDFDHQNNDISNLILLPKELHQRYHQFMNELFGSPKLFGTTLNGFGVLNMHSGDYAERVKRLSEIVIECQKWVRYKEQLDLKIESPYIFSVGGVNL